MLARSNFKINRLSILTLLFAFLAISVFVTASSDAEEKHEHEHAADNHATIVEDSMHEFMEYVFQPTYKRLKVSMATEPEDKAGWLSLIHI